VAAIGFLYGVNAEDAEGVDGELVDIGFGFKGDVRHTLGVPFL
jgi:hypothetical protein